MKKLLLFSLVFLTHFAFGQYSGTPLMLSLPMDQDTIEEDEPVFVWQTTLSNVQNDPRLNVQLAVVKMEADQTQTEAMVENTPVFIRQNLLSTSLNYSSIDHELEEGVWYAWQVVLFYNGVQVQQSEVWKFIKTPDVEPVLPFIVLRKQADNSIHNLNGEKLFVCTKEQGQFSLTAEISGKKIGNELVQFTEVNAIGESISGNKPPLETRYFTCDLSDLDLKKGTYRLEWTPSRKGNFVLFFEK